ncbi:hypothetical protein BIV23_10535 [Streptomyces monashensis]|uniref:CprB tetracyclin repressor-like C-terminal domain-containing protein n=1 Tax=Streptomyces monashensis TaxID=1678012 RepID=A0A1S2QIF2_9ACTN|nr:hypothetical protein BIV23_10535 [Streptomyces monashensis]
MAKGAVYFHFPHKEGLAVAVVEEHYACWPQILAEVDAENLPPLETAIAMLDRAALAFRDSTVVQGGARLQIERPQIDAEFSTPFVDWTSFLTSLLAQTRDQGQIRADAAPPDAAARALVAGFFGTRHVSDVLHQRTDLGDRRTEIRDPLLRALRT